MNRWTLPLLFLLPLLGACEAPQESEKECMREELIPVHNAVPDGKGGITWTTGWMPVCVEYAPADKATEVEVDIKPNPTKKKTK